MIAQAKARGIRVISGTLVPFKGWRVWDEKLEAIRQAVNDFLRHSDEFEAVVDVDKAIRDPADPLPACDSGGHLLPNDAGYRAMAAAVDLFKL